jgi:site-specific DNA-cytosine methylase
MLDLFSGLGGASQAMKQRGWNVITVDIEPRFEPTHVMDVKDYKHNGDGIDLLWASPPCIEFSKDCMPKSWHRTAQPDTALLEHTVRIINEVKPRYWIIENVRGAVKHFKPIIGSYKKKVGSRYLWGEFPIFWAKPEYGKWRLPPSENRPALRSKIPYSLSLTLAVTIERELGVL